MTRQAWGISLHPEHDEVHVVPVVDGVRLASHVLRWDCQCRPSAVRDGPWDEPIASHHEPGWPGSKDLLA